MSKKELRKVIKQQMSREVIVVSENVTLLGYIDKKEEEIKNIEGFLKSAEYALIYKEKLIDKYKKLLSYSIEDL